MKKINVLLLLPLLFICASTSVFAKPIQSDEEIAGNWLLKYTKKSLQESESKAMDITWVLENQTLTLSLSKMELQPNLGEIMGFI
ncbi:MAG: hypothetical protein Q8N30_08000 [Methylococcales bacterium]|nr:hypothetical protein [Methylococcales bacterium]